MQTFTVEISKEDVALIDTTFVYPAPAEAFAWRHSPSGKVSVSTVDKVRFGRWTAALRGAGKLFQVVEG